MTRTFIEVPIFTKRWHEIGLGEAELLQLQILLLKDPESGPVYRRNRRNQESSFST